MAGEFWLSDRQWAAIAPLLPVNQPGARRVDDRRVISGIVHMLRNGGRWQDCPACYGPPTIIYNRYHRWSGRGIWTGMLAALAKATPGGMVSVAAAAHCEAGKACDRRRSWARRRRRRPRLRTLLRLLV